VAGYSPHRVSERGRYHRLSSYYALHGRRKPELPLDQVLSVGSRHQTLHRSRPPLPWGVQVLLGMLTTIFCFACAVMTVLILGLFRG
jgi:hypothetical protein